MILEIQMNNIKIRFASDNDIKSMLEIYAWYISNSKITFDNEVPKYIDFENKIKSNYKIFPCIVCEINGQIVGYSYVSLHFDSADKRFLSIYLKEDYTRYKIGRALYTLIFELLKLQGYKEVYSIAMNTNIASIKFHESFGFKPVGSYPTAVIMEKKLDVKNSKHDRILKIDELDKTEISRLLKEAEDLIKKNFAV